MYYKKLIDDLLHELSYRSTEGYPILSKKEHQSIISEILTEWGDFGAKEIIMNFLTEGPKVQEADETGYTHIGAGVYVRNGDVGPDGTAKEGAQKYSQDESGRFSPISEDDYETMKSSQGEEGEDAAAAQNAQTAAQAGGGEAGVDGGEGGGQPEEPQTGTSLKDPSYQDGVKREKKVQDQIAAEKNGKTEKVSPSEEEQKLKTEDSTKVKKQILMTADEAKKQQKGVGLGTPESRTGESVTVYAGQKIQELMQSGMTYEQARVELENELLTIARDKNYILTEDWVKSGLAVFDHLNDDYGFENVKHFAWDTPQGNKLVGATDHGTSADMFVQLQDGTIIGVSLKKGFKVFIVNGGYAKAMKEFEEKTGISFSENCQIDHYMSRRDSMLSNSINTINGNKEFFKQTIDGFLSNPDEFEKTFGKKAAKNRKSFLVAKKLGISIAKAKAMSDEERDSVMETVTSDDVISYITDTSDTSNDRMKFMSGVFKIKDVDSKFGIYKELRGLDNEMTENMFQDIKSNSEKEQKLKEKIVEDTHIIDTLFPNKPLGDFKTIFGEKPAVEMTRAAIVSIFGINELWKQYNAAKTDEEKQEIRKQIEREITSKLKIDKKNGVPVISISVKNEDGSQSDLPLYKLGVRTRGIGNAQTLRSCSRNIWFTCT
jgi:hypothetical protein